MSKISLIKIHIYSCYLLKSYIFNKVLLLTQFTAVSYLYPVSLCCVLVTQLCPNLCNPMTVAHQAPPPMGFLRQEYWSGLPFLSPRDLPNLGIEPWSPELQAYSLLTEPPGTPHLNTKNNYNDTPIKKKKLMTIQVDQNILN